MGHRQRTRRGRSATCYVGHNDFNSVAEHRDGRAVARTPRTQPPPAGFSATSSSAAETLGRTARRCAPPCTPAARSTRAFHRWRVAKEHPSALDVRWTSASCATTTWATGAKPFTRPQDPVTTGGRASRATGFAASPPARAARPGAHRRRPLDRGRSHRTARRCSSPGATARRRPEPRLDAHVRRSTNRGRTWSADVRTVSTRRTRRSRSTSDGLLGLLFQQVGHRRHGALGHAARDDEGRLGDG